MDREWSLLQKICAEEGRSCAIPADLYDRQREGSSNIQRPQPPTFEQILDAGYSGIAAKAVLVYEQFRFDWELKPYGDKDPEGFAATLDKIGRECIEEAMKR